MNYLIKVVAGTEHDFEWYPTTDEIIAAVKLSVYAEHIDHLSILDCGAGDGRVLAAFDDAAKYAIEKSEPLLDAMPKDVFIVGTEFKEQTLIDKKVDIVFSNPPYSEYVDWAVKIITEANARIIYLVIPSRWVDNERIAEAIKLRDAEAKSIGSFDFLNAERAARAKVDVVKISLSKGRHYRQEDPFDIWFEQSFSINADMSEHGRVSEINRSTREIKDRLKNELIGGDLVGCLEAIYQADLANLIGVYKKLETLDYELLKELNVSVSAVCGALKLKITGLKDRYWKELFDNLHQVVDRLTNASRKKLMDKLTAHTHIDFTASNARALIIWILKNSNIYIDNQLIEIVESLTEKANIHLYKSNMRTFGKDDWIYSRRPNDLDKYSLDHRIVLHRSGGMHRSTWLHERNQYNGLSVSAYRLLEDVCTVAANLGYTIDDRVSDISWEAGKKGDIHCTNIRTGKEDVLFSAKAFKNGNLYIKMNSSFIVKLNAEFGRLNGWLKTPRDAVDEMGISESEASSSFNTNMQITKNSLPLLTVWD